PRSGEANRVAEPIFGPPAAKGRSALAALSRDRERLRPGDEPKVAYAHGELEGTRCCGTRRTFGNAVAPRRRRPRQMMTTRRTHRVRMQAMALALLASAAWWPIAASAEDAPPPPLSPALERLIPQLTEERK